MPSFLTKVFGRKKDDPKESPRPSSDASLLDGKFEAVPLAQTPTTPRLDLPADAAADVRDKEKDGFTLFRKQPARIPPAPTSDSVARSKVLDYHLSLNLPGPKEESTRALGVVFEADPDAQILLPESVIAERRLSPLEAFLLVQACSQAINARGLETLGIMVPHWYSASPSVQRKLISLFIQSLALKSPITTLSPSSSSPVSSFESEMSSTRSPYDVAAVLRWGLRHLQLDNSSFGKDEQWYSQFLQAEKASDYPPRAFTEKLVPLLPPAHLHLLTAALEIFSSLAAHAEANSISGSKLSKMLGLWILSAPRITEGDDTLAFYANWDKWGRILEHLFLARIRDEAADHRMPTRLMELVKHYPYAKPSSSGSDAAFVPSPRFSTRRHDALFVRIDTEMASTESKKYKNHPLRLIADALKASSRSPSAADGSNTPPSSSELELWESLKKHVSVADADSESYPGLSSLFADETIRFLSLIPTASDTGVQPQDPQPFTLVMPATKVGHRRSMSLGARDKAIAAVSSAHAKTASGSGFNGAFATTSTSPDPIAIDWGQFSMSGFFSEDGGSSGSKLAATLLDNKDVEITLPRKASARRKVPPALIPLPSSRGKSLDLPSPKEAEKEVKQGKSRATKFQIVQLDEAFVDFWSDALLDPISADWPAFVVCKIKSSVPAINAADSKRVGWLIIEQRFVTPKPPQSPVTSVTDGVPAARPRPNSPKPSLHSQSDSKSTKKKRFSFFTSLSSSSISSSSTIKTDGTKGKKKAGKGPSVGEMGEILKEEEEESAPVSEKADGKAPNVPSAEVLAVATGAVAVGSAAVIAAATADTPKAKETPATLVEDVANTQVSSPPTAEVEQPASPVDVTHSLVQDVTQAQVPHPTEIPVEDTSAAEPTPIAEVQPAPPLEAAVAAAEPAVVESELVAHEPTPPPAPADADAEPEPEAAPPVVEAPLESEEPASAVIDAPILEPELAPVEPEVAVRLPTPPPVEAEPLKVVEQEPAIIAREPTPPPVVEEPPIVEAEPEVIAREPTPSHVIELEPAVVAREPTPPPPTAEPEIEEVVEAESEPAVTPREPTPPPPVAEPIVEAKLEPEVIARELTPPPAAEPEVEEAAIEAEPEPIPREPTPPPPVVEPEVDEPVVEAIVPREPTPPPVNEPEVEAEPEPTPPPVAEPESVARESTPPVPEPEVEEPIVVAEPEPEVIAREPTPPAAEPEVEEAAIEAEPEPAVIPREPTPPPAAEPEVIAREPTPPVPEPEVEEPIVAAEPEPEVIAREPTPPPAPEPEAEEAAIEAEPEPAVIPREPTPPPAAEPEVIAREPTPPVPEPEVEEPIVAAEPEPEVIAREPTPPPASEPEAEEAAVEAEPEPAAIPREPTLPPVVEPEPVAEPIVVEAEPEPVEKPVVETEPEPEIVAGEPTPPPISEPEVEEALVAPEPEPVVAREPTPPIVAEPEVELVVEAEEPAPIAITREPTPPPAVTELEPESDAPVEELAVEQHPVEAPIEEDVEEGIAREPTPPPEREPTPPLVEEPEVPAAVEPEPEVMIVNDERVPVVEPVTEEADQAPAVEEAVVEPEPMQIIEPAAPADNGLQFDTAAEVISGGHTEPLREPEAANDAFVELPAVPVVEARPELVRGSTAISHLELAEGLAEETTADGFLPGGETPGPQVALSIAEVSAADEEDAMPAAAEEEAPMHETNGNGVDGHEHDDTDKPSE